MNELPAVPFRQTLAPLPVNVATAYNATSSKIEKTHAAQNTNSIQTPASRRVKAHKTPKDGRDKALTTAVEDSSRGAHRGQGVVYPPLHNALPTVATTPVGHHASPPPAVAAVAANTVAKDEVKDTLTSSESAPPPLAVAAAPPTPVVADTPSPSINDEGRPVSLHPPTGAKPQMPSRRPSLARLRVPGRLSPQPPAPGSTETQTRGLDTADAAHTHGETSVAQQGSADGFDTAAKLALFSYRPDLTPAKETVFTPPEKILPGELRSPSGATSIAAAAAGDTSESASDTLHSSDEGHRHTSPSPPHNKPSSSDISVTEKEEGEEKGKEVRCGMRNAEPTSSERPGDGTASSAARGPLSPESNAHFHALQFLPASSHYVFCSPPHSGRSEASEGGLGASSCAAGVSRTAKPSCGGGAVCSEHKNHMGDEARRHRDGGGEAGEQMACPLASLGCCCSCCTGGVCTPAGVSDATALHRHLCAMATYVQRMQERQAELEKAVVALQRVVATQDCITLSTDRGAQVNGFTRAHQGKAGTVKSSSAMMTDSPLQDGPHRQPRGGQQQRRDILGNITHTTVADVSLSGNTVDSSDDADGGSSQHNSANVSHTAPAVSSSAKKAAAAAAAAVVLGAGKAFPGDVSIREPHTTDDDDDDDDNGDDGEKNGTHGTASESAQESDGDRSGDDRCGYAGQLRLRSRSAQQLYALRDATESGNAKHLPVLDSSPQRSARGTRRNTMPAHAGCSGRDTHGAGSSDNPERLKEKKKRAKQRGTVGLAQRDTPSPRPLPTALSSPQPASSSFFFTSASAAAGPRGVAGSSTEVSGMSNVPPYQLREESVSTIRSGSCNLDDHEDDLEVGEMRQQLMNLSAEAKAANRITAVQTANASAQQKGEGKEKEERRRDSDAVAARDGVPLKQHKRQHAKQGETSGPSIPSIISATYTPSQLAHSPAAAASELPSNSNANATDEDSLAESLAAAAATAAGTATTAVDMVRLAAPLQRPTLIRKTDVVADGVTAAAAAANLSSRCAGGEQTHRTAPQLRPRHSAAADGGRVPLAHLAGSSAMPPFFPVVSDRARPAAGIMTSNTASLKARRMREPDSEGRRISTVEVREQLSILTDENNKEAGLTGGASFSGVRVNARVQEAAEAERRDVAAGRYSRPRSSSSAGFPQQAVSAHHTPSAHAPINGVIDKGEEDALRNRSGAESKSTLVERRRFAGSAGDGSARRRHDASRPRHGSNAAQRPQHATSMLSTREAAALGDGAPLSTPPY